MILRKPDNWDNISTAGYTALPDGNYVIKVIAVKVGKTQEGLDRLEIAFDIAEGEYTNYYRKDFDSNTRDDKKWRGVVYVTCYTLDGSDKDAKRIKNYKTMVEALESSNPNFQFNWDKDVEPQIKGKLMGCSFPLKEWVWNGKKGWKAQPKWLMPADDVRSGKAKKPKFEPHKDFPDDTPDNYSSGTSTSQPTFTSLDVDVDYGDLPFDCRVIALCA